MLYLIMLTIFALVAKAISVLDKKDEGETSSVRRVIYAPQQEQYVHRFKMHATLHTPTTQEEAPSSNRPRDRPQNTRDLKQEYTEWVQNMREYDRIRSLLY